MAFFCKNWATVDSLRQRASCNASSGVEYARFIIEHPTYDPFCSTTNTGKTAWPKGTNYPPPPATGRASFQCFDDPQQGTATISIATDGASGYNISSTGSLGTITATINKVHYVGGKIEEWN